MNNKSKVIIDHVKNIKPRSKGHKIVSQDGFCGGKVAKVEFTDNNTPECISWVVLTKHYEGCAASESQLIQCFDNAVDKECENLRLKYKMPYVSSIIALVIVLLSAYLAIKAPDGNIPDTVKNALFMILGFYFSGFIQSKNSNKKA